MNNKFKNYFFIILAAGLLPVIALAQFTLTFTNAAATGRTGPTQTQVNTAYDNTTLDDAVTINTQGYQEWTVPGTGAYTIEVWGAAGGNTSWGVEGKGVKLKGIFTLTQNQVLKIIVGQEGTNGTSNSGGGGGGTIVYNNSTTSLLIAAGGGGGAGGA